MTGSLLRGPANTPPAPDEDEEAVGSPRSGTLREDGPGSGAEGALAGRGVAVAGLLLAAGRMVGVGLGAGAAALAESSGTPFL